MGIMEKFEETSQTLLSKDILLTLDMTGSDGGNPLSCFWLA